MSPEKQQAIYDRYPEIFRDKDASPQESCMHWGLECNDGWADIIDALCAAVSRPFSGYDSAMDKDGVEGGFPYEFPQVRVDQLKEKWGLLRVYYHLETDPKFDAQAALYPKTAKAIVARCQGYVDGVIGLAETLSARTCEDTGKPGTLHVRGGRYKTLCTERAKELGYLTVEEWKRLRAEVKAL